MRAPGHANRSCRTQGSHYLFQSNPTDGTKSTSSDGSPLKYRWNNAPESPVAALSNADTATPIVQFPSGPVPYIFELTVTDAAGRTATDKVTVNFARSAF